MTRFEILVEGDSDVPTVREIMIRRFGLVESEHFRIHPHRGRGTLPLRVSARPEPHRRGLLDQLPAKLIGYSTYLDESTVVLVLLDVDRDPCAQLLANLNKMLNALPVKPPRVLFRLAIEETESWFIADLEAVKAAYTGASTAKLRRIEPDAIVGASQALAGCLRIPARDITGPMKYGWATRIAPHLDLHTPRSPSLRKFIDGVSRELSRSVP